MKIGFIFAVPKFQGNKNRDISSVACPDERSNPFGRGLERIIYGILAQLV